jgi:hypothetical protein
MTASTLTRTPVPATLGTTAPSTPAAPAPPAGPDASPDHVRRRRITHPLRLLRTLLATVAVALACW